MESTEQDRKLREKLKEKDIDFQQQLRSQMQNEEKNLKNYFKEFNKPIAKDPTKIKRAESSAVDREMLFKQAARPFTLFKSFYEFWNMQCNTAEQNYTLSICKKNLINNFAKGIAGSLLLTSLVSFRYRAFMRAPMHIFGAGAGIMSGLLFGAISSTRFTLEQFEKLGDSYELGKIAAAEIEKYRMDKPLPGATK